MCMHDNENLLILAENCEKEIDGFLLKTKNH